MLPGTTRSPQRRARSIKPVPEETGFRKLARDARDISWRGRILSLGHGGRGRG